MRLNKLLLLGLFLIPALGFGQKAKLEVGIKLGAAAGLCDIGGISNGGQPWLLDLQPSQIEFAFGGYIRYKINHKFSISAQFDWMRLQGFDSLSKYTPIRDRNLNYRNDIKEGALRAEWTFYTNPDVGGNYNYTTTFSAYLFGGFGIFHMSPEEMFTHSWKDGYHGIQYYPNDWYPMHTLTTEGEKQYSLIQPTIPLGIGFHYTFNKLITLGWELVWNKCFTDYIDDVSTKYPVYGDDFNLVNPWDKYLTNQAMFVPGITRQEQAQYGPGSPRGNPKNDDSFVSTCITVGVFIKPKLPKHMMRNFFNKNNYKSRASF